MPIVYLQIIGIQHDVTELLNSAVVVVVVCHDQVRCQIIQSS